MANRWDPYRTLIRLGPPVAGSLPTPADLDAFEARRHLPLPASFRDFALAFGVGTLRVGDPSIEGETYYMAVPGFRQDCKDFDPIGMTRHDPDSPEDRAQVLARYGRLYADGELAARLIFFCEFQDAGYYAWDPQDVTDPDSHDYAIYFLREGELGRGNAIPRVAESFERLVLDVIWRGRLDPARPELALMDEVSEFTSDPHLVGFDPQRAYRR